MLVFSSGQRDEPGASRTVLNEPAIKATTLWPSPGLGMVRLAGTPVVYGWKAGFSALWPCAQPAPMADRQPAETYPATDPTSNRPNQPLDFSSGRLCPGVDPAPDRRPRSTCKAEVLADRDPEALHQLRVDAEAAANGPGLFERRWFVRRR